MCAMGGILSRPPRKDSILINPTAKALPTRLFFPSGHFDARRLAPQNDDVNSYFNDPCNEAKLWRAKKACGTAASCGSNVVRTRGGDADKPRTRNLQPQVLQSYAYLPELTNGKSAKSADQCFSSKIAVKPGGIR